MVEFLYCLDYDDCRSAEEQAMCTGNGIESKTSPSFSFTISPYATSLIPPEPEPPGEVNPLSLVINAQVYIIADKYDVQELKEQAAAKYKEVLPRSWNSSAFTDSARMIYENTPETDRTLRNVIVQGASENAKKLLDRGEFIDLLKSHGALAADILKRVLLMPTERKSR